jgi:hypothetical protein
VRASKERKIAEGEIELSKKGLELMNWKQIESPSGSFNSRDSLRWYDEGNSR